MPAGDVKFYDNYDKENKPCDPNKPQVDITAESFKKPLSLEENLQQANKAGIEPLVTFLINTLVKPESFNEFFELYEKYTQHFYQWLRDLNGGCYQKPTLDKLKLWVSLHKNVNPDVKAFLEIIYNPEPKIQKVWKDFSISKTAVPPNYPFSKASQHPLDLICGAYIYEDFTPARYLIEYLRPIIMDLEKKNYKNAAENILNLQKNLQNTIPELDKISESLNSLVSFINLNYKSDNDLLGSSTNDHEKAIISKLQKYQPSLKKLFLTCYKTLAKNALPRGKHFGDYNAFNLSASLKFDFLEDIFFSDSLPKKEKCLSLIRELYEVEINTGNVTAKLNQPLQNLLADIEMAGKLHKTTGFLLESCCYLKLADFLGQHKKTLTKPSDFGHDSLFLDARIIYYYAQAFRAYGSATELEKDSVLPPFITHFFINYFSGNSAKKIIIEDKAISLEKISDIRQVLMAAKPFIPQQKEHPIDQLTEEAESKGKQTAKTLLEQGISLLTLKACSTN